MNREIQTLRGIACILVVYFHVIGTANTGLKLPPDSIYRMLSDFLIHIRMPLFTFLSGYIYTYRRFSSGALRYVKGKSKRILIPLVFVSVIFATIQALIPGANNSYDEGLWLFFLYPYAHFWFLQSIFTIFMLIALIDFISKKNNRAIIAFAFLSVPFFLFSDKFTELFSFSRTLYLLPFFIFGMLCNIYSVQDIKTSHFKLISVFLVLIMGYHFYQVSIGVAPDRISLLSLLIGCLGSTVLVRAGIKNTLFIFIGGFSYSIYLYHVFGTAFSRIFLNKIGVDSIVLNVFFGLLAGVALPIIFHLYIKKIKYINLALLGSDKCK